MNAATMHAGTPGDEASFPHADGMANPWSAACGPLDDDAVSDRGDSSEFEASPATEATREARAPGLALQATEQQLAQWLDAIVGHDERALSALYDATFSRVFGVARRIVRNTALAEEVVEDTYFQVWRQAVRFDPTRGKASTWLLSIAYSRAIDALRREARFQSESLDDEAVHADACQAPPNDELLDLARQHADLHRAMALLGAQPRQLVSLAFFRGLSHEEIAQRTQLPLGTVKSQIRRALLSLRQVLGDSGLTVLAS